MASGLSYAGFLIDSNVVLLVLLSLITVGFALICLYTSQDFQLKVAKLLTIIFALLMAFVVVGVAAQAGDDLYKRSHPPTPSPTPAARTWPPWTPASSSTPTSSHTTKAKPAAQDEATTQTTQRATVSTIATTAKPLLEDRLPANVSSLYLAGLIGIFFLAAMLHPTEAGCLGHGFWYLLCLPSGYLLLIVYSICNMTDRSWGK